MRIKFFLLAVLLAFPCLVSEAREVVSASSYGIRPDTKEDVLPALRKAFRELELLGRAVEFRFEPGCYHIHADCLEGMKCPGVTVTGLDSLFINGQGAKIIGHGAVNPFSFTDCRALRIEGLGFDWDRPLISQGTITGCGKDHVDITFDRKEYPFRIRKGKAVFHGDGWELGVDERSYSTIYDKDSGNILQGTKDYFLSRGNVLFRGRAKALGRSGIRFYGTPDTFVEPGHHIALYHGLYLGSIFRFDGCSDIVLKDIDIWHSPGMGVRGTRCENILLENFKVIVNRDKSRCFSAIADALHFNLCRGLIELKDCVFDGQGDDALNVHGRYNRISHISQDRMSAKVTLTRGTVEGMPLPGEHLWFIDTCSVTRAPHEAIVCSVSIIDDKSAWVQFAEPVPGYVQDGSYVENASWTADVKIHGCTFGKANRARGILLTSPGNLEVYGNHFHSAGTAILVEGDISYWFESGAVTSLDIHDNEFIDCATSVRDSITHWGWGEAVITVTPSIMPENEDTPAYHKGILIRNNIFKAFDLPLVFARSVDSLIFRSNTIEQTQTFRRTLWHDRALILDGCRNVIVKDNYGSGIFKKIEASTSHMKPEDLYSD